MDLRQLSEKDKDNLAWALEFMRNYEMRKRK